MSHPDKTESPWSDTGPDQLVPEAEVPERAAELEEIASDWLNSHAQYFDIYIWDGMKEKIWKKKAFNEAGTYLINARNHGAMEQTAELKEQLIERVNDRRFSQLMLRNQADLHHFAYPTLFAAYEDAVDSEVISAFERVAKRGEFWSSERLPYRLLEFCNLCRTIGVGYEHNEETILQHSLLNHQPNIVKSNYIDAYCLTHDVMFYQYDGMYYHDYPGTDNYEPLSVSDRYDITTVVRGLILRYMAEENLDITLELLLAGILQRQISRELARIVLSWALEAAEQVGHIPGPPEESMYLVASPKLTGIRGDAQWNYEYQNEEEAIWAQNYHTNIVAGMTARVLQRDWNKLDTQLVDEGFSEESFRTDSIRLGQLLKSLAHYDIEKGARQMIEIAESSVSTKFPVVFRKAVDFLKDQRNGDGEFGYWTDEEILYTNNDNSRQSFQNDLLKPANEACRKALEVVETTGQN